jgi:hypothetical protein
MLGGTGAKEIIGLQTKVTEHSRLELRNLLYTGKLPWHLCFQI